MAYDNNQNEFPLPVGNNSDDTVRKSSNLLPRYFRTPTNTKFLYSTLDQLLNPGTVEKINAFYGRKHAKAFNPNDNYINEVSDDRQNYQLEPVVVRRDNLNNVMFYKDYVLHQSNQKFRRQCRQPQCVECTGILQLESSHRLGQVCKF
jgi:hypothetical protein